MKKAETIKLKMVKCPRCGYTWTPRVPNPKECPRCKRYI